MQPALNGGSQKPIKISGGMGGIGVEEKLILISIAHSQIRLVLEVVS